MNYRPFLALGHISTTCLHGHFLSSFSFYIHTKFLFFGETAVICHFLAAVETTEYKYSFHITLAIRTQF